MVETAYGVRTAVSYFATVLVAFGGLHVAAHLLTRAWRTCVRRWRQASVASVRCSTGSDHQCQGDTELERATRQPA
jgi:hypothetical protein